MINENNSNQTLGNLIKVARKDKNYSQKKLATLVGIDFTYLSKIENDRADYPPKEPVIEAIARELELDENELIFLSGRVPENSKECMKKNYKKMPALFRRLRENPDQFKEILEDNYNF